MNFIKKFKEFQEGLNKGLTLGNEAISISKTINGLQRGRIYGIAAAPKVGKTTFVDDLFIINPILEVMKENSKKNLKILYNSFEISRIEKEFDFATYFLNYEYNIKTIKLNTSYNGKEKIELSPDYLKGRLIDDKGDIIKVKDNIKEALYDVYYKYIIPIFGEYNENGVRIKEGFILFKENRDNPTGIYKNLLKFAEKRGKFKTIPTINGKTRKIGYVPDNKEEFIVVVTDHLRKLIRERNFSIKETIDKYIEYSVDLKNLLNYSFIHILHLNRNVTDDKRVIRSGKYLYPNSDDVKDTGNLSEEADYMFTLFNPNDDRYNLKKHFDIDIKDRLGNLLYPNMRTIHLVESRHCYYPQHFRLILLGNIKKFKKWQLK